MTLQQTAEPEEQHENTDGCEEGKGLPLDEAFTPFHADEAQVLTFGENIHAGDHTTIDGDGDDGPGDVFAYECAADGAEVTIGYGENPVAEEETKQTQYAEVFPKGETSKRNEHEEPDEVVGAEAVEDEMTVEDIALAHWEQCVGFNLAGGEFLGHEAETEVGHEDEPHALVENVVGLHAWNSITECHGEDASEEDEIGYPESDEEVHESLAELVVLVHGMPLFSEFALFADFF